MSNELITIPETTPSKEELQEQLKAAIKKIDNKLKRIGGASTFQQKSIGNFKMNELDGNTINIFSCQDIVYLIKALALVKRIKAEYIETAEELGLKTYPVCTWVGCSVDAWIHDLRHRITLLTNATLIQNLTESRRKLTQFLTEEQRLHSTLTEIQQLLKG